MPKSWYDPAKYGPRRRLARPLPPAPVTETGSAQVSCGAVPPKVLGMASPGARSSAGTDYPRAALHGTGRPCSRRGNGSRSGTISSTRWPSLLSASKLSSRRRSTCSIAWGAGRLERPGVS